MYDKVVARAIWSEGQNRQTCTKFESDTTIYFRNIDYGDLVERELWFEGEQVTIFYG